MKKMTKSNVDRFLRYLINEEKSACTQEKYRRDLSAFTTWLNGSTLDKAAVLAYKDYLIEHYAPASVNSILSALNSFFTYYERHDLRVKTLKIQRALFASKDRELSKEEYGRLLDAAKSKNNERLYLLMQTVCSTGIRVSELRFITVEAVGRGMAEIRCKGKIRQVFLPRALCAKLTAYSRKQKRTSGAVFVSRTGKPLDRCNIWAEMKKLCAAAGVSRQKVFPHNLRHLFARTYYSLQKDIVRLADVLGHSHVDTTRIYTMETGEIHKRQIERLGLLRC